MIASLKDLVAPLDEPAFLEILRRRELVHQPGATAGANALLDWPRFLDLLESGAFPADKLEVTHDGIKAQRPLYMELGKINARNLSRLLERGASLIAVPVDPYVPELRALCAAIAGQLGEKVYAGAIATTGSGGAIRMHYDPEDLIIMQIEGSKRWLIHGPPVAAPVRGMDKPPAPDGPPLCDVVLAPGDFLFVPAGYWHHCENGPGLSLHVGVFLEPPSGWAAVRALLPRLVEEEMIRTPLTRFASPAERAAHEATVKARLAQMVRHMSLDAP